MIVIIGTLYFCVVSVTVLVSGVIVRADGLIEDVILAYKNNTCCIFLIPLTSGGSIQILFYK